MPKKKKKKNPEPHYPGGWLKDKIPAISVILQIYGFIIHTIHNS